MWSDRISAGESRCLVEKLCSVMAGCAGAPRQRGFAIVGPYTLRDPLATVSYSNGFAEVAGPAGTIHIAGPAFDILEAVLEAWRDRADAVLAGFLSYELAAELEDLGPLPRADFDFPQFFFGLYERAEARTCGVIGS